MSVTEAEEDIAEILTRWDAEGHDTAAARAQWAELRAIVPGDDTPPPGTLMLPNPDLVVIPEPLHEGPNETREGKFYQHTSGIILPDKGDGSRNHKSSIHKRLNRHGRWLTLLWLCSLTFAVTAIHAWRPGWP